MSVKCGHCGSYGQTIAHVKECSNPRGRQHLKSLVSAEPTPRLVEPVIPTLASEPVEGVFYKAETNTYYKVQQGTTSGVFYAKEFNHEGEDERGSWEYAGRAPLHFLTALDRITAEEAARFGKVTGVCVFCSRKLTDERSITVGYGPICAEREGLPWGELV